MDLTTTSKFILFAALIFCGIYFFIFKSVKRLAKRRRVIAQGETVQATIVDNIKSKDLDGVTYYHPVIKFRAANGQDVTVELEEGSTIKRTIGKKLHVRYLSSLPKRFVISEPFPVVDILSIVAGLVCIALSFYALIAEFW